MNFSPLRKLALRLACIHEEDRTWLLSQLAAEEQKQLNELLDEIDVLGLASDPAIVARVMAQPSGSETTLSAQSKPLQAMAVHAEHPFWAALALQGVAREQRQVLFDRLPSSTRTQQFDTVFQASTVPPALVASLQSHLATKGAAQ